jgi:hypothetical protein
MKRILVLLAVAAFAVPAAASAKGPQSASIDGPGTGGGIDISGDDTALGDLTQHAGLMQAVFGQSPDPMQKQRPKGNLGPEYTITYAVAGPAGDVPVRQDVYPYASPPVTYTKPGQELWDGTKTHGGWFMADAAFKSVLVRAGLPKAAPGDPASGGSFFSAELISLFGAALLLAATTTLVIRRRARPTATA